VLQYGEEVQSPQEYFGMAQLSKLLQLAGAIVVLSTGFVTVTAASPKPMAAATGTSANNNPASAHDRRNHHTSNIRRHHHHHAHS
jgi:ABC-type nickel/cobalt efflux system permease component RcnA